MIYEMVKPLPITLRNAPARLTRNNGLHGPDNSMTLRSRVVADSTIVSKKIHVPTERL